MINSQDLVDKHGRHIHKLRVSLLDACNMRCMYCMPEDRVFVPTKDCLTASETIDICTNLVELGIDEIRLTGGEPLIRSDVRVITEGISQLKLKKFGLTTNAIKLKENLSWLKETNCKYLNISLDSLNKEKFFEITKANVLEKVLDAILTAKEMGFIIKLNVVLMKGVNDNEILDFLEFSAKHDIEVRFLELMKIGVVLPVFDRLFMCADDAIKLIEEKWSLEKKKVAFDSTSFNFIATTNGLKAQVGFIASESKPFCGGCSRLRVGPKGKIRPCLMLDHGVSLKNLNIDEMEKVLWDTISLKPQNRINKLVQPMYQVGG